MKTYAFVDVVPDPISSDIKCTVVCQQTILCSRFPGSLNIHLECEGGCEDYAEEGEVPLDEGAIDQFSLAIDSGPLHIIYTALKGFGGAEEDRETCL